MDVFIIGLSWAGSLALVGFVAENVGWRRGRRLGQREGFTKYTRLLRFERREQTYIGDDPDQPHATRPGRRARVTTAHMSQSRRYWFEQ